jgi:hypothetical protein
MTAKVDVDVCLEPFHCFLLVAKPGSFNGMMSKDHGKQGVVRRHQSSELSDPDRELPSVVAIAGQKRSIQLRRATRQRGGAKNWRLNRTIHQHRQHEGKAPAVRTRPGVQ